MDFVLVLLMTSTRVLCFVLGKQASNFESIPTLVNADV